MDDLISRQATIRFIRDKVSLSLFMKRSVDKADKACMELCEMLDREWPPAEVEPVKRGKWIYDNQFHWYRASCSECGYMRATDIKADNWNGWKYCPNCGARMSEGSEE